METDNQHPIENYLDFLGPDDIRIKGTRMGIETVCGLHLMQKSMWIDSCTCPSSSGITKKT